MVLPALVGSVVGPAVNGIGRYTVVKDSSDGSVVGSDKSRSPVATVAVPLGG